MKIRENCQVVEMGIDFICICLCFCYVCRLPSTLNGIHNGGGRRPPPLWRRPKAASIEGAGEAANIAKTLANAYEIYAHLHNLAIFPYFHTGASAAIPK